MVKSRYHKKLKFGSKGRNTRNDGYPLDRELPAVRALALLKVNNNNNHLADYIPFLVDFCISDAWFEKQTPT